MTFGEFLKFTFSFRLNENSKADNKVGSDNNYSLSFSCQTRQHSELFGAPSFSCVSISKRNNCVENIYESGNVDKIDKTRRKPQTTSHNNVE